MLGVHPIAYHSMALVELCAETAYHDWVLPASIALPAALVHCNCSCHQLLLCDTDPIRGGEKEAAHGQRPRNAGDVSFADNF